MPRPRSLIEISLLPLAPWAAAAASASGALGSRSWIGGAATEFALALAAYVVVARRPPAKLALAAHSRSSRRDGRSTQPIEETTP